jgi:N-acetylglucosamine-6-phosphate deacetylase
MGDLIARRYDNGELVRVCWTRDRITSVEPTWSHGDLAAYPFIAPGLFDLQINGHAGAWFSDVHLTADAALEALAAHFRYGITRLCPTLITNSREALECGFQALRRACEQESWAGRMACGFHLEGPYLSAEDGPRGAHPVEHVRPCDWSEFEILQRAAGGRIRLLTLAPESPGAPEFIRRAVASGVRIAIGHTAADATQIAAAVDAGAALSTHLGNGAHGMIRRHPNYIWDQLGDPRLSASVISDGHHLPASVVRSIVRAKGLLRTIITCDASGLAGCAPGIYRYGSAEFEVLADGPIVVAGQRQILAGSGQETDVCVANMVRMAGVSLGEAWEMAARNPARLLGFEIGRLARGGLADLALFDRDADTGRINIRAAVAGGEFRYTTA